MFINNKYTKWYFSIVENAKQARPQFSRKYRKDYPFYELHHIVPRCMDGSNTKENLVLLSPREHFICHVLLTKMVDGHNKYKMAATVMAFKHGMSNNNRQVYVNSRLFELARVDAGKFIQSIHQGRPKPKSQEHKRKASDQMKRLFAEGKVDMSRYEKAKETQRLLVWLNKGGVNIRVVDKDGAVGQKINDGWAKGRTRDYITEDFCLKLSQTTKLAWEEGRRV